jgi:hypothetical protein
MAPGDVLVVEAVFAEAAVEDADEAVGQDPERSIVGFAFGPVFIVEGSGAG